MNRINGFLLLMVAVVAGGGLWGCGSDDVPEEPLESASVVFEEEEGKADELSEFRIRTGEMTLWMRPYLEPERAVDGMVEHWQLLGRTSRNLVSVESTLGEAEVISARRFVVELSFSDVRDIFQGAHLELMFEPTNGGNYWASMDLRGRVDDQGGSYRIYPWLNVFPVVDGGRVTMRGRVTVPEGFEELIAFNDGGTDPDILRQDERRWILDWHPAMFVWEAAAYQSPTHVRIFEDASNYFEYYEKFVSIRLAVFHLTMTNNPDASLEATCEESTRACIESLTGPDLEECGYSRAVLPCL